MQWWQIALVLSSTHSRSRQVDLLSLKLACFTDRFPPVQLGLHRKTPDSNPNKPKRHFSISLFSVKGSQVSLVGYKPMFQTVPQISDPPTKLGELLNFLCAFFWVTPSCLYLTLVSTISNCFLNFTVDLV